MTDRTIVLIAGLKGTLMAWVIIAIAETTFLQGLITAICSAFVSGSFLLISTHMTAKRTDMKLEQAKKDILEGQETVKSVVEEKLG